jgi:transposase
MPYSDAFKATMVQKLAGPRGPTATQLAREVGVHQTTLSRWLRQAGRVATQDVLLLCDHPRRPMSAKRPQDWTAQEKLEAVIEAASVPEAELGAFLRRKGLHEAQLREWREIVLSGLEKRPARSTKKPTPEARRVRELERELARKDKALAEAAALLVLQKNDRRAALGLWAEKLGRAVYSSPPERSGRGLFGGPSPEKKHGPGMLRTGEW